jgi:hypothetical protein
VFPAAAAVPRKIGGTFLPAAQQRHRNPCPSPGAPAIAFGLVPIGDERVPDGVEPSRPVCATPAHCSSLVTTVTAECHAFSEVVYGSRKLRVAVDDVAAGGRFFVDLQDAEPSAVELDLAKELIERSTALQRDVRAPARGSRERNDCEQNGDPDAQGANERAVRERGVSAVAYVDNEMHIAIARRLKPSDGA